MKIIDEIFEEIIVDDTFISDYSIEDASMLIEDAKSRGFDIPKELTPDLYIKMYNARKPSVSKDYLMQVCIDCAENCLMDGIESVEDASRYLTDLKLNGYSVPKMLTPALFIELYNKYS